MITRAALGLVIAAVIAAMARRRGWLTDGGALMAVAFGMLAVAAGWHWGVLLVAYFAAASLASAWRRAEKSARTDDLVEKAGARDAKQVLANGGVFVGAALVAAATHSPAATAAALGALAASLADTWATEVGSALGGAPRLITTGERVEAGRSGGVSFIGSVALLAGSAVLAALGVVLGLGTAAAVAGMTGGIAGAMADSLLGALVQERRRCPVCGRLTERRLHARHEPPAATTHAGGVRGFDNDWVNLTSTALGALLAAILGRGGL